MKKVCVIGMGYVGFPLACAIARKYPKYDVYGVDIDEEKIRKIKDKVSPVDDEQAQKDIQYVHLTATKNFTEMKDADIIIVCVPTPVNQDHEPELDYIGNAMHEIAKYLKKGQLIILESTVNPGVCDEFVIPILNHNSLKAGKDFDLIHCPERIDPGNEKWNVYNIPRNIGGTSKQGTKRAADFYREFINAEINEVSSLMTAEATKIVENTFRDINIAYVNELAKSFDMIGIDIMEVIRGAASKPFAFMAHYPGSGVGGHCIPVDPYYLITKAQRAGFEHIFLKDARRINNGMPGYTVQKLVIGLNELELPVKNTKIGILGLSYKPNIGDIRESPSFKMIKSLAKYKPQLYTHDPYVQDKNNVELDKILTECEAVIVATSHKEFLEIEDWKNVKLIVDGRNCLDKEKIKAKGIMYKGIGSN